MREHIITELVAHMDWVATLPGRNFQRRIPDWWSFGMPYFFLGERLESADRKRISRAVESLAREGSIERFSRGNGAKTTHIRPSVALVRDLVAKSDPDMAESLRKALRRSAWGQEILRELAEAES